MALASEAAVAAVARRGVVGVRKPRYILKLLEKAGEEYVWTVRKRWDAETIDEVVLLAGLQKAWEEAERAARVRRAKQQENILSTSWRTEAKEEEEG